MGQQFILRSSSTGVQAVPEEKLSFERFLVKSKQWSPFRDDSV